MRFYESSLLMEFFWLHSQRTRRTYSKFSAFFYLQNLNRQRIHSSRLNSVSSRRSCVVCLSSLRIGN
jgi:hypothetical protein